MVFLERPEALSGAKGAGERLNSVGVAERVATYIGCYYTLIHIIFMISIVTILLFSNNITYLTILLIILVLDIFVNILSHDCPLTSFEDKYSQNSTTQDFSHRISQLGICCNCNHIYEKQLNALLNIFLMILGKIIIILLSKLYRVILVK